MKKMFLNAPAAYFMLPNISVRSQKLLWKAFGKPDTNESTARSAWLISLT